MRLRQLLVIALSLSLLGISAPAWSQADSDDCRDLMAADTPAYVVCRWMATPEEAADIARFWLDDDGRNMRDAGPMDPIGVDCREPGNECPTDLEGDGELHDVGSPDVEGAEDGGQPECETAEPCYVDPDAVTGVTLSGITPSAQAVKTAAARGVRVWIDTELADDHQAGKLAEAAKKVAALAAQPGVAGIRFSTGLGQDQRFATADELDAFVTAASAELRKVAPGKKLAVHTSVPALGCGAVAECTKTLTEQQPLLDPDRIGGWLTQGLVDQLILDSGHLATAYTPWQIDAATARRNQSIQVRARAWDAYAQLAAEETGFTAAELTAEQATQAITDRIAAPLQDAAAATVLVQTRWRDDQGRITRAYGEQWAASPAWDQLKKLTAIRPRLATLYDPATPEVDVATDVRQLSEVFGQLYIRA